MEDTWRFDGGFMDIPWRFDVLFMDTPCNN